MTQAGLTITSTSIGRLELLKRQRESIERYVAFSGTKRFLLHEDWWTDETSGPLVDWATMNGYEVIVTRPRGGQGFAVHRLMAAASGPYYLNVEDDYCFVSRVDLDLALEVMDQGVPKHGWPINQLRFNHRETMAEKHSFKKFTTHVRAQDGDHAITSGDLWVMRPAVWRRDWIRARSQPVSLDYHHVLQEQLGRYLAQPRMQVAKIGTWIWGHIGMPPVTQHLAGAGSGWERRTAAGGL